MLANAIEKAGRALCAGIVAALVLGAPCLAGARPETLRWEHEAASEVTGFTVHWGTSPRRESDYSTSIDVEKPAPDADGVFSYDFEVPDAATVYVAVTAHQGGLESDYSNERMRLGMPGKPTLVTQP